MHLPPQQWPQAKGGEASAQGRINTFACFTRGSTTIRFAAAGLG